MTELQMALDCVKRLDAEELEEFFDQLRDYFANNADVLTNMDAIGIACHLSDCQDIVMQRTSN